MSFENVELARQAYYAKKQRVFKNRMIIAALLSALAIIIDVVVFLLNINDFSNSFATEPARLENWKTTSFCNRLGML